LPVRRHILYVKRDDLAAARLAMIEKVPTFKELTEEQKVSLETKSTKLFTLAALYDANIDLLKGHEKSDIMANAARAPSISEPPRRISLKIGSFGLFHEGSKNMDHLTDDPLLSGNANLRKSTWEYLKACAAKNDTNISAEMRRILREAAERDLAAQGKKKAA
jgi:hypothetical protein